MVTGAASIDRVCFRLLELQQILAEFLRPFPSILTWLSLDFASAGAVVLWRSTGERGGPDTPAARKR